MINYERSHPAPNSLSAGNYNTQDVLNRLVGDAKNKCYLCESLGLVSVNTEHLVPHRGDKTLRLDWKNLLLSCAHCNSTKGDYERFHPVLDPCDFESRIIEGIEHRCEPWPTEKPTFIPVRDDEATQKTVALLTAIFDGTTVLKKLEAHNFKGRACSGTGGLSTATERLLRTAHHRHAEIGYPREDSRSAQSEFVLLRLQDLGGAITPPPRQRIRRVLSGTPADWRTSKLTHRPTGEGHSPRLPPIARARQMGRARPHSTHPIP